MLKRVLNFGKDDWKHLRFLFLNMIKQLFKGDFHESKEAYYWIKIHFSYESKKMD